MTDDVNINVDNTVPPERRMARSADQALANSSPDTNSLFMRMVEMLLGQKTAGSRGFAAVLMLVWVIAVVGVPALLAGQVFVDKWMQAESAKREFELSITKAKTIDAGGEILTSIKAIGGKIDAQGRQITQQGEAINQLSEDVKGLKESQAATDKRVAGVAAKQGQMEKRFKAGSQDEPVP